MNELLKFVFGNFFLLFAIWILWIVAMIVFMLRKRKRRSLVLPKANDENVVFSERFASGSSNKSWKTRLGGASNCLTVIVTDTHVAITPFFPFSVFAGVYDLEHLILITDITDVEPKGRVTEIVFKIDEGANRKMSLQLRDTPSFIQALKKQTNREQDATLNSQ